jgi:hypothetical protein
MGWYFWNWKLKKKFNENLQKFQKRQISLTTASNHLYHWNFHNILSLLIRFWFQSLTRIELYHNTQVK